MDEDVIGSHVIGVAQVPVALLRGDGLPEVETIALTKSLKNKENRGQIKIQWKRIYDEGEKKVSTNVTGPKRHLFQTGELPAGTVAICVHAARHLVAADKWGTSDPYCTIRIGKESFKTPVSRENPGA